MKVPARRRGNDFSTLHDFRKACLNESPRPKAGKFPGAAEHRWVGPFASMKVPARRRGNSHPKLARNYAAETGALREPRGRPTQKVYPSSHLSI